MSVETAYAETAEQIKNLVSRDSASDEVEVEGLTGRIGGASRDLFVFDAHWKDGDRQCTEHCVLLRDHEKGCLDTSRQHEFDVLSAMVDRPVAAPVPLWVDPDGSVLGRPGIVLRYAHGDNARVKLGEYSADARAAVEQSFVDNLVNLHTESWDAGEFPHLKRPTPEDSAVVQLDLWEDAYREAAPEGEPGLALVLAWLREHRPVATRISLIHGDYRYGNVLFDQSGLTAIVDWELAHFGDPAEDLVWPFRAFRNNTAPLQGWSRFLSQYQEKSGIEIPTATWHFYRVLSAFETGVMCLAARVGFASGGSDDLVNGHMGLNVSYHAAQALRWIDEIEAGGAA